MFSTLLALVGSISLVTSPVAHGLIAFSMFAFAFLHMIVFYYKIGTVFKISRKKRRMIQIAIFLYVPFNIIVLAICATVVSLCSSHVCWSFAINMQPVLEYSTISAFMIYMLSFSQSIGDNEGLITRGDSLLILDPFPDNDIVSDLLFGDTNAALLLPGDDGSTHQ